MLPIALTADVESDPNWPVTGAIAQGIPYDPCVADPEICEEPPKVSGPRETPALYGPWVLVLVAAISFLGIGWSVRRGALVRS